MHPSDEDLATLALRESGVQWVGDHVEGCHQCETVLGELIDTIGLVRDHNNIALVEPPSDVWDRIETDTRDSSVAENGQLAGEAAAPARRRFGRAWMAGGIAAGVLVGVVASQVVPRLVEPQPSVIAQATLATLDTSQTGGQATVTGQGPSLDLTLTVKPLNASAGFLEVWLINTDLKRMVSIGVLPSGATQQQFPITRTLIDQGYVIVDISQEQFDDRPQHSGDSLLRGKLS